MKQLHNLIATIGRVAKQLRPSRPVAYLLVMLLIAMGAFTLIRLVLLLRNLELLNAGIDNDTSLVILQMFNGMRFDLALLAKVWIGPLAVLAIGQYLPRYTRHLGIAAVVMLSIAVPISLMIAIGDIPYFEHFNNHVNAMAIKYMANDLGEATGMVLSDMSYLCFAIVAILAAGAYIYLAIRLARRHDIYAPVGGGF